MLQKQLDKPVPRLRDRREELPEWLDRVVQKALAKKPDERFVTALKLIEHLREKAPPTDRRVESAAPAPVPVPALRLSRCPRLPRRQSWRWSRLRPSSRRVPPEHARGRRDGVLRHFQRYADARSPARYRARTLPPPAMAMAVATVRARPLRRRRRSSRRRRCRRSGRRPRASRPEAREARPSAALPLRTSGPVVESVICQGRQRARSRVGRGEHRRPRARARARRSRR